MTRQQKIKHLTDLFDRTVVITSNGVHFKGRFFKSVNQCHKYYFGY